MDGLAVKMQALMGWDSPKRSERLTLRTVSEATGLSATYLWMLLRGVRDNPSADTIQRLAAYFGTDVSYFHEQPDPVEPTRFHGRVSKIHALIQVADAEGPAAVSKQLLEAWDFVRESGPAPLAARIALHCVSHLKAQKDLSRAERILKDLKGKWTGRLPVVHEVEALMGLAHVAYDQARYFEAVERMETCLDLIQSSGHQTPLLKDVWYNLGIYYRQVGKPQDSMEAFGRALELYPPDQREDIAFIHMGLGRAYHDAGMHDEALEHSQKALDMLTELGNAQWAGSVSNNLGDILCDVERWQEARARYEAGMLAHRVVGYPRGLALNLSGVARCQLELGDARKALSTVNQAIAQLKELEEHTYRADAQLVRSRVHMALSDWKSARRDLGEAKAYFYEHRMVANLMRAVGIEAELDSKMGAFEEAAAHLQESARVFRVLANHVRPVERAA